MDILAISIAKALSEKAVAGLLDSSPETVAALQDLVAKLNDDPTFVESITTEIDNKVDKEEGMVLVSADDAAKLARLLPIAELGDGLVLQDGVLSSTGSGSSGSTAAVEVDNRTLFQSAEGQLVVKVVEENGLVVTDDGIAMRLATETSPGAITAEQFVKLKQLVDGTWSDSISGALIGGVAAEINGQNQIVVPVAGDDPGVVKSSDEDNGVTVMDDGRMEINRVSASKLFVPDEDELILCAGSALETF